MAIVSVSSCISISHRRVGIGQSQGEIYIHARHTDVHNHEASPLSFLRCWRDENCTQKWTLIPVSCVYTVTEIVGNICASASNDHSSTTHNENRSSYTCHMERGLSISSRDRAQSTPISRRLKCIDAIDIGSKYHSWAHIAANSRIDRTYQSTVTTQPTHQHASISRHTQYAIEEEYSRCYEYQ